MWAVKPELLQVGYVVLPKTQTEILNSVRWESGSHDVTDLVN